MNTKKKKASVYRITNFSGLKKAEELYRRHPENEEILLAKNTTFLELCTNVFPDRDGIKDNGEFVNTLFLSISLHPTTIGAKNLSELTKEFLLNENKKKDIDLQILSISTGIEKDKLRVVYLIRVYSKSKPKFNNIFNYVGDETYEKRINVDTSTNLIVPDNAYIEISDDLRKAHKALISRQNKEFEDEDSDIPVLNRIYEYIPKKLYNIDPRKELIYDLRTKHMQTNTTIRAEAFLDIFKECLSYITSNEKDAYYSVLRGKSDKKVFLNIIDAYVNRIFILTQRLPAEDKHELFRKLDRALFDLYIVQDLIDDPEISDIKITDPYAIRVRVKGKAYKSNVSFIDDEDYLRFIKGIAVLNNIDLNVPTQTFTDEQDDNFILRFSITAPYITSTGYPIIHIRKLPRNKLMSDDLIKAGMMDEKIRDYLIDCGKFSSGVVFAGPPGSGKTTLLNWFLEDAYESSAEILVIQENDELFASYRNGVMFEHVVLNPQKGEQACSLEMLGQMALVSGANVFVIGEAKGAEITSAITLSNSGCRTAITIHSQSSLDTIDKMADLAMRGNTNTTYDQAKRMIKSFQTIVYMEDFKIKEISEIVGYDENKKDMIYKKIYEYGVSENN